MDKTKRTAKKFKANGIEGRDLTERKSNVTMRDETNIQLGLKRQRGLKKEKKEIDDHGDVEIGQKRQVRDEKNLGGPKGDWQMKIGKKTGKRGAK